MCCSDEKGGQWLEDQSEVLRFVMQNQETILIYCFISFTLLKKFLTLPKYLK